MTSRQFIAFGTLIVVVLLSSISWTLFTTSNGDPADRFEVIRLTSEQGSKRHAVTYLYDHANSSSRVIGTWLGSAAPPAIGSTDRPKGAPVFIWTGKPEDLRLNWSQGRVEVTADRIQIRSEKFNDCYFATEGKRTLCFDSNTITLVD